MTLSGRQQREVDYHKHHALDVVEKHRAVDYDVVMSSDRRWWNAYWDIWTYLLAGHLKDRRVLVIGCGGGEDALRFAKIGAIVSACDLSPDMLAHGRQLAATDGLTIDFSVMPCEEMRYADNTFDVVFARDILHHVDIPQTMNEIIRVAKPAAMFVADEIYSHSITDTIRRSWLVERFLYPKMQAFLYKGEKPYITRDERKMTEHDIALVKSRLVDIRYNKYFNFLVTRIVPDTFILLSKIDRIGLMLVGRLGVLLAGRIAFVGSISKVPSDPLAPVAPSVRR